MEYKVVYNIKSTFFGKFSWNILNVNLSDVQCVVKITVYRTGFDWELTAFDVYRNTKKQEHFPESAAFLTFKSLP